MATEGKPASGKSTAKREPHRRAPARSTTIAEVIGHYAKVVTRKPRVVRGWPSILASDAYFEEVAAMSPMDRLDLVRARAPSSLIVRLSKDMGVERAELSSWIGIPRSTLSRKLKDNALLSVDETDTSVFLTRLIAKVDHIVRDSGQAEDFDAAEWVHRWLTAANPALGGRRPADMLISSEGQAVVLDLIERMQSAAYA